MCLNFRQLTKDWDKRGVSEKTMEFQELRVFIKNEGTVQSFFKEKFSKIRGF